MAAIEFVDATGEVLKYRRDIDPEFQTSLIHMGCLGPVASLELDIVPAFEVQQTVYNNIEFENFLAGFHEVVAHYDSVVAHHNFGSGYTDALWLRRFVDDCDLTVSDRVDAPPVRGDVVTAPVPFLESGALVETTIDGAWLDVMHFFMDSSLRDVYIPNLALHTGQCFIDDDDGDDDSLCRILCGP